MSGVLMQRASGSGNALTATASTTGVSGIASSPGTARTLYVTVTVTGGQGPYTYEWTEVGAASGAWISHPTSESTRFSYYFASSGTASATFKCTVTDATTATADTANVSATFEGI